MRHFDPNFHSFTWVYDQLETSAATDPILMTESVYNGFRRARPDAIEFTNGWIKEVIANIQGYSGKIYGCDVFYEAFR